MALGYSVVNGTNVFPGIRYTGRLAGDPLGQMTLGEGTIINGSGVQTTTNSRWGDYTDMTVDPVDDCTFWYVNEYYTAPASRPRRQAGRPGSPASSCRGADPLTRPGPARRVPSRRPRPSSRQNGARRLSRQAGLLRASPGRGTCSANAKVSSGVIASPRSQALANGESPKRAPAAAMELFRIHGLASRLPSEQRAGIPEKGSCGRGPLARAPSQSS